MLNHLLGVGSPLTDDQVATYLRENFIHSDAEKLRRRMARERIDLFHDRGKAQIDAMVDDIFKNAKVRHLRKQFTELASFQNLTKRIVREVSSVYSEPATRRVRSRQQSQVYADLQRSMRLDRRMRLANQMWNLCNDTLLWFGVWLNRPVLRVVTPDKFWAVPHPDDPTTPCGYIVDKMPPRGIVPNSSTPRYVVMDDAGWFYLNDRVRFIPGSRRAWGLSRMPLLLAQKCEPVEQGTLLNPDPGADIVAAHKALALINTMMLKHQKSGTKQPVAAGDLGDVAAGQPMDEEHVLQVGEGVSLSTLDLGADPRSYIDAGRAVIKQIAANYGIPESVFDLSYQATSGFEIELKRTGLREVRRDQLLDFRPIEHDLAMIMSEYLAEAGHPLAFNPLGWSIDFGEVETPQDPMQRLSYWKELRSMGLMNTVEMYMEMNPEATEAEALEAIRNNAEVEAERVQLFRELNIAPNTAADGSGQDGNRAPFNGGEDDEEDEEAAQ